MTLHRSWRAIAFDSLVRGGRVRRLARSVVLGLAVILLAGGTARAAPGYVADLKAPDEAAGPARHGQVTLALNEAAETLRFELSVFGVDSVVGSHFHMVRWRTAADGTQIYLDPAEGEGPIIAFFLGFDPKGVTGNGVIAEGLIKKTGLFGDFAKRPLNALIENLDRGRLYATVHVLDTSKAGRVFCCPVALRGFFRPAKVN